MASPELMDLCVDLEDERVSFSGAGSHGTSEKSGTVSVKLGSAPWESVTAQFARLPAGIDMILGLDNGLNKVDVAQREARIGPTDFVFQIQSTRYAGALDSDSQKVLLPYLGWVKFWRSTMMFLALEKWSAASKLPPNEIELLPGATPVKVPPHHMSAEDEQVLEDEVKEMLDKGIMEKVKNSKWVFPFFIARGKSRGLSKTESLAQVHRLPAACWKRACGRHPLWSQVVLSP
jgi:hypothetical protein